MQTKVIFIDTNILIDLLCHREHCAEAATVVNMGIEGKVTLYCSSLTIANCVYSCRKTLGKERTTKLLRMLCDCIKIAPCGQAEVDSAFIQVGEDFEYSLQYYSAIASKADIVLTRNGRHFSFSSIPVMDCSEFLESTINENSNRFSTK